MVFEVNTTDELFALLWECRAVIEDMTDSRDIDDQNDNALLLDKLRAVTDARVQMAQALKLRVTGDASRDTLVSERINLRAAD
jgi:hypothetical protein